MGSNVVLTYKRKRLFSRSDHSHINLHSDTALEISKSKASANFDKNEEPIAESRLQNAEKESGIQHENLQDKVGENMLQCENQDSSISNCIRKSSTLEQERQSPKSDSTQRPCNLDVPLEGSSGERCQIDFAGLSNAEEKTTDNPSQTSLFVKSGSECEDKSKETSPDKLHEDNLCNNLVTKRKLGSTLITFCRRSKRNRDIATPNINSGCAAEEPPAAIFSVDLKNEKVTNLGNPFIGNEEKDSRDQMSYLQGNEVCMGVQDKYHVNQLDVKSQSLSNGDVNTTIMPTDVSGKRDSPSSLDLSIPPPASRDIDCNLPPDCDSDEDHPPGLLEVTHDSIGSTSKIMENSPTQQLQSKGNGYSLGPVGDKGKLLVDSPPVSTSTSSRNNYLQLFPENTSNHTPELAKGPENMAALTFAEESRNQRKPSSARFLQYEQTVNNNNNHYPCYSSLHHWPNNIHMQSREAFQDVLNSTNRARHKMMLDSFLTRARAPRGYFDSPPNPTTWSEEELDCLWIGVRRHGRGNWDNILRDQKLNFLPWKTTRDLAERWQEEQYKLVVSQVKYANPPPDFYYPNPSLDFMNIRKNVYLGKCNWGGPGKGSLPHWLREAVEMPPMGQWGPSWMNNGGKAPCVFNNNTPLVIRREETGLHEARVNKQDELIVIPSDASSEETISDDR